MSGAGPAPVVLLHGLWMSPLAMGFHARALVRAGYPVARFGYPSMHRPLAQHAQALSEFVARLSAPVHVVAHSMGGLVALAWAAAAVDGGGAQTVGRIVLLGTPLHGSVAGRALERLPGGARLLGASRDLWRAAAQRLPQGVTVGVIAGSAGIGLGRLLTPFAEPNDGTVAVAETRAPGLADHLVLPVSHTGMLASGRVAAAVRRFLADGRFQP